MKTAQQPNLSSCPTAVATEVLLLQPRGVPEPSALWPLFVMVVTEPAGMPGQPLSDLLEASGRTTEPLVVTAETAWSVLDAAGALLAVTVRAAQPWPGSLRIVLPAGPVLDALDMVARGAPLGITTRDRAERLRDRVDVQAALRDVVFLSGPPSPTLTGLADLLRITGAV